MLLRLLLVVCVCAFLHCTWIIALFDLDFATINILFFCGMLKIMMQVAHTHINCLRTMCSDDDFICLLIVSPHKEMKLQIFCCILARSERQSFRWNFRLSIYHFHPVNCEI